MYLPALVESHSAQPLFTLRRINTAAWYNSQVGAQIPLGCALVGNKGRTKSNRCNDGQRVCWETWRITKKTPPGGDVDVNRYNCIAQLRVLPHLDFLKRDEEGFLYPTFLLNLLRGTESTSKVDNGVWGRRTQASEKSRNYAYYQLVLVLRPFPLVRIHSLTCYVPI